MVPDLDLDDGGWVVVCFVGAGRVVRDRCVTGVLVGLPLLTGDSEADAVGTDEVESVGVLVRVPESEYSTSRRMASVSRMTITAADPVTITQTARVVSRRGARRLPLVIIAPPSSARPF